MIFSVDAGLLEKSLHLSVAWAEDTEGLPPDERMPPPKGRPLPAGLEPVVDLWIPPEPLPHAGPRRASFRTASQTDWRSPLLPGL